MGDISGILANSSAASAGSFVNKTDDNMALNMQDFLTLMVTELQNQTMDDTADTSEMLNQMVMMQMVSALTNMTDASVMSYAASLVGKTVTIGQVDAAGNLQEIVGEVTGTGMMDGQQVVFVNDKYYYMNEIMAVGTLPSAKPEEIPEDTTPSEPTDPTDPTEPTEPTTPPDPTVPTVPTDSTESKETESQENPGVTE